MKKSKSVDIAKLKSIIKRQDNPKTADYRETKAICPTCQKPTPHSSKVVEDIPKHFQTYYCEECANLFFSTQCIHILREKD